MAILCLQCLLGQSGRGGDVPNGGSCKELPRRSQRDEDRVDHLPEILDVIVKQVEAVLHRV
jgi:hypothetical protein